eukprot:513262-Rhodomonas_salina.1
MTQKRREQTKTHSLDALARKPKTSYGQPRCTEVMRAPNQTHSAFSLVQLVRRSCVALFDFATPAGAGCPWLPQPP